jgi:hypothetical protein
MVLDTLKKRLHDAANTKGGKWTKELPNALWGLRTQPSKPMGQSPYFLVYGSEAILPADVMWDSPAVEQYDEGISEDNRRVDIDGLEEPRCAALVQSARYLEGIRRYHDRNVKERSFNVGDLVPHPEHGRTTQAQLALGRSLHSFKGDRTGLLQSPDA